MSSTQISQHNPETALQRISGALQGFKNKFSQALPKGSNVDREISSVLATVANTPALQKCTPKSIAMAAYTAASLGLPVNALGLAYLVPYKGVATLQIGYKGYIQKVSESGHVLTIDAFCVYERDTFDFQAGSEIKITHKPFLKGDPGAPILYYAIAQLANGLFKCCVMTVTQINKIRDEYSQSWRGDYRSSSPWFKNPEEQSKKTVIKRLCKTLPLGNVTLQRIAEIEGLDNNAETGAQFPDAIDMETGEVIEHGAINATIEPPAQDTAADAQLSDAPTMDDRQEINPLVANLVELQSEIERLDVQCDKLPALTGKTDEELRALVAKKTTALKRLRGK